MTIFARRWPRIVATLSMLTLFAVLSTPAGAAQSNPGVVPPNARFMGKSYGEWHAAWWQWAFSMPNDHSPFNDPTGANCALGQSGHVWFLAGTLTTTNQSGVIVGEEHRTCTVPAGTALLFPLINTESSTAEGNGATVEQLDAFGSDLVQYFTELNATIDGQPLANLTEYRAKSPGFTWGPLPDNNFLGLGTGTSSLAVADGYMVLVTPLSVGTHTITFGGQANPPGFTFVQRISYTITVAPEHKD